MNTYEILHLYDYNRETDMYESENNGGTFTAENDLVASFSFGMAFGKLFPKMDITRAFLSPNEVVGIEIVNCGKTEYVCARRKN